MNEINITAAKYIEDPDVSPAVTRIIKATIDGEELFVPMTAANRHYAEIMRQVAAGTLTIADAD